LPRRSNEAIDQEKRKPPITASVKPGPAHFYREGISVI